MLAMSTLLFADLGMNIGAMIVNALAVAGAGAFGYFATRFVIWFVGKFVIHRKPPPQISRVIGILGGVAMALLIAGLLFKGQGGGGWGFGPGFGFGTGSGTSSNGAWSIETTKKSTPETTTSTPKTANPLRIRMLGGSNVQKVDGDLAFYRPKPGNEAYTLDRLKTLIRDRMQAAPDRPAISEIVIVIEKDSVAHNHPAVIKLEQFAKDQGLTVTVQRPPSP